MRQNRMVHKQKILGICVPRRIDIKFLTNGFIKFIFIFMYLYIKIKQFIIPIFFNII